MLYQNQKIARRVNFLIVREQPYLMKNFKFFSAFLFPLFAIALLVSTIQSLSAIERPNVLLITADDLGIQLSCYGDPIANTSHIDALAARSVRFKTAYVSQASCSPSRSTMFTGLYHTRQRTLRIGQCECRLPRARVAHRRPLAKRLKTGRLSYWHYRQASRGSGGAVPIRLSYQ